MDDRNAYMLKGKLKQRGYDWWWHSLVGVHAVSGEKRPFFIEYYVINPERGNDAPIPGQLPVHQQQKIRPSYAMLKAGAWGSNNAVQIHNLYGIRSFSASPTHMEVKIGEHFANETHLSGAVKVTPEEARDHPEWMSDAGEMTWDLQAEKILGYNVGFGAAPLMRRLNAFQMYWHVQGMLTHYDGHIWLNGEKYLVRPETSAGYQDKNWGTDYTSPWVWLNCNRFTSRSSGQTLTLTSLDVGGAQPVIWGQPLPRRLLIAFYYEGRLYEFNFSKIWTRPWQSFKCTVTHDQVAWDISAQTKQARIEIHFSCPRSTMLRVNYENPDGEKRHNNLWNGGYASGSVTLYQYKNGQYQLVDIFDGELGGCEYGEQDL